MPKVNMHRYCRLTTHAACLALFLGLVLACGGGGGAVSNGGTATGGTSSPVDPVVAPPTAIFPVSHEYTGASYRSDITPFVRGLVQGNGKFYFVNNGDLMSFDPATSAMQFGPMGVSGEILVYEGKPWSIGGGLFPTAQSFEAGKLVEHDLYDPGRDYGFVNAATSDGQGHLYIVCEGHKATNSYPARGATLLKMDVNTLAITAVPFRPWTSVDEDRALANPYSSIVVDAARNLAFILSYYHHDITRIDLSTGAASHFASDKILDPSDLILDRQGNAVANQKAALIKVSSKGEHSYQSWPAEFAPGRLDGSPVHDMVMDSVGRIWVAGKWGRLVCMAENGAGAVYPLNVQGADYPSGLLWSNGRLWLSANGSTSDNDGRFLEIQVPVGEVSTNATAPHFSVQPSNLQLGSYQQGRFQLRASGNGTLSYQWQLNGVPIPRANASFYDILAATGADVGTYTCTVTNSLFGQILSKTTSPAVLTLVPDPSIATLSSSSLRINTGQSVSLTPWFVGGTGVLNPGGIPVTSGVSVSVSPSSTTSYELTVTNPFGAIATAKVTIAVNDFGRLITEFSASPKLVDFGQPTTLAWVTNQLPTNLSLRDDLGLLGPLDLTGSSQSIQSPSRRQTFLLTASTAGITETASIQVAARGMDRIVGHPGGWGSLDGLGTEARITRPSSMASASDGRLIFADDFHQVIRQVTLDGSVSTLSGSCNSLDDIDGPADQARFTQISGLAMAPDGTLYILDHGVGKLKKLSPSGVVSTVALLGGGGGGTFHENMTCDSSGNLYIPLHLENRLVKVSPSGTVVTVASNLTYPNAVALLPDGTVVVTSDINTIYLVKPDGSVLEVRPVIAAGEPGAGTAVTLFNGVTATPEGRLYLACVTGVFALDDSYQAHPLCQSNGSQFGTGSYPNVAATAQGFVWTARTAMGSEIIKLVPGEAPVSVAGLIRPYSDSGAAVPPDQFDEPCALAQGPGGDLIVADSWLGAIRQVSPTGVCRDVPLGTMAGSTMDGSPVWCDASGQITYTVAGQNLNRFNPLSGQSMPLIYFSWVPGIRDGGLGVATAGNIRGLVGDHLGNIYFTDMVPGFENSFVRRLSWDGTVSTIAGGVGGYTDGQGASACFKYPSGIAIDPAGNLIVADQGNHAIRKVTLQGEVTTVAGGSGEGHADGLAAQATFNRPGGVAVDPQGNIFVADSGNACIRVITPDGQVSTLLGNPLQPGTRIGPIGHAGLYYPSALLVNQNGDLIVTDSGQVLQFTAPLGH